jgi:hypothetical protein
LSRAATMWGSGRFWCRRGELTQKQSKLGFVCLSQIGKSLKFAQNGRSKVSVDCAYRLSGPLKGLLKFIFIPLHKIALNEAIVVQPSVACAIYGNTGTEEAACVNAQEPTVFP